MLASELAAIKYADLIPAILRTSVRHGMRMPRDFVLVTKQMLYFDRYAKLLAPEAQRLPRPAHRRRRSRWT